MEEPYCAQCVHYIPHYIKFGENLYDLIRCGHCIFPRKKHRDAYAKPCNHFQKIPKKRDRSEPENPVERFFLLFPVACAIIPHDAGFVYRLL